MGLPSSDASNAGPGIERDPASNREPESPKDVKDTKISIDDSDDHDPAAILTDSEKAVIQKQVETPETKVNFFSLYRYAKPFDLVLVVVGSIMAIVGGALFPLMTVLFGQLAETFKGFTLGNITTDHMQSEINRFSLYFLYLAVGEFVTVYISTAIFGYTGETISSSVREQYLAAIFRQNIGYFDKLAAGEIITRITTDCSTVQDGISEKIPLALAAVATFFAALVIGFILAWKLTFILLSTVVALVLLMNGGARIAAKYGKMTVVAATEAGTVAQEVISSVQNTKAFDTAEKLVIQYDKHLQVAEKSGRKLRTSSGLMISGMMCIVYLNYGLSFWQGGEFLARGDAKLSGILTVMMAIMLGALSLGNLAPSIQLFTNAVTAVGKIYTCVERESPINPESEEGDTMEIEGNIELRGVRHRYPSRPTVGVLKDVSLVIPTGKVTAIVGASGSGKSSIVSLILRFYEPVEGQILLDGRDIHTLNLKWLRRQISLVSQEIVLFNTSVFMNVCYGLIGTNQENASEAKKRELVVNACRMSNVDGFIRSLPQGYDTAIGGFLMSGGQKQRIALARAIIKEPRILLLDEATSALDTKSEGLVQAALDKAANEGRTTLVIAHRLNTIRNAANIVVMADGRIAESGTHDELLSRKGAYYDLIEAQEISGQTDADEGSMNRDSEVLSHRTEDLLGGDAKEKVGDHEREQPRGAKPEAATPPTPRTKQISLWKVFKFASQFNRSPRNRFFLGLGLFASIICGGGHPTQAVLFAKAIVALSRPPSESEYREMKKDTSFWAGMYLMLAGVMLISYGIQGAAFAYSHERHVHTLKHRTFRIILRQDISFFDRDENSSTALTSVLGTETNNLAGVSGIALGTVFTVITTLISAIAIGCAIGWKLGLVCTALVPIVLACGFYRFHMLVDFQRRAKMAFEKSAEYACEAATAVRTVASLTMEKEVCDTYHKQLAAQAKRSLISILRTSTLYAMSQSLVFGCMGLGFWYGGSLIRKGEYDMLQFFTVFAAIIFSSQAAGTIFSFSPDIGKAIHAAQRLKPIFDSRPTIDSWDQDGEPVPQVTGYIEFRGVHFHYPTRPDPVLRGLDIIVKPGQYVALVGSSGCGKSTTISLLERFYNPVSGRIFIDGRDITTLKPSDYRHHLALVSQEPILYRGTIRENILLGSARDDADVPDDAVINACKIANIYDFIVSLPDGFDTLCGPKGVLLSGGQKQRIAIARALIRDPKILLLDEATSALDSENERAVQAALDEAAQGRTTVAVAHRLSTIQKADMIYVLDSGRVLESGTHSELLARKGRYSELVSLENMNKKA